MTFIIVWEEMSFEEFQDYSSGGHLGYLNRSILVILNLCVTMMRSIKFWLNPTYCLGGDVEEFQDGGHLGYRTRTVLPILKLCDVPITPIKFRISLTYGLGGDVV